MKSNSENSRREFLKVSGLGLFGAAALGTLSLQSIPASAQAPTAAKTPKLVPLAEAEPMAKTLGYHIDATKVDTKKWPKRAGAEGKIQLCSNCLFFNGGKPTTEKMASCSIFAGKSVATAGWCNSWAKNPAVK
jgi:hypothetical protein